MRPVLVDSNVIIDIAQEDPNWFEWSVAALGNAAENSALVINPLIYTEVSISYQKLDEVDAVLPESLYRREPLPYKAGFDAGKAFMCLSSCWRCAQIANAGFLYWCPCSCCRLSVADP